MIEPEKLSKWSGYLHQVGVGMRDRKRFLMVDRELISEIAEGVYELRGLLHDNLQRSHPTPGIEGCQFKEHKIFDKYLPKDPGTYVDIGAGDAIDCSNTWHLYQRGWRGLLVEPLFWWWPSLLRARRGDHLVESAVRNYTGKTLLRVQGSVSSVIPSWDVASVSQMIIDCERGVEILDQFPVIRDACQFCSIDVEGAEAEVIESIDWHKFRPKVLCVEYRTYDPEELGEDISQEWQPQLLDIGYELADKQSCMNKIFLRT